MFRGLNVLPIVILAVLAGSCLAAPECGPTPEQCREHRMHPDLPEPTGRSKRVAEGEKTNAYWQELGKQFVKDKLAAEPNKKQAKNVIMFLGDGMGVATTTSARNLLGGEEQTLSFDRFPYTGLSKTYSVTKIVSDSACTATAYLCGVKAQQGTIGVSGEVPRSDCKMLDDSNHVYSIAKWAQDAGKWTGLVTTTRVTHASPAGVYAHTSERDWENDQDKNGRCEDNGLYKDIAYQLARLPVGKGLKVIMGGGRRNFIDNSFESWGSRRDGRNLIRDFKDESEKNAYVVNLAELNAVDLNNTDRIMGLFAEDHMLYRMQTNAESNQPTLEEMTRKAIEFVSRSENGYFLFIEGGRIDHAHHDNQARQALNETIEFSNAIAAAREMTSEDDTLIVVTADHSHVFSYAGYAERGGDVFGMAPELGDDGLPYTILSYSNGPSFGQYYDTTQHERKDPTTVVNEARDTKFPAGVPLGSESHGGDDVPVYASGPWSHLFTGVYEQNTIPHMMAYASCVGDGHTMCDT